MGRRIDEIIVHCSATDPKYNIGVPEIRDFHHEKGWNDIGYHWVIRRDGYIEEGRPEKVIGAHVYGRNRHSLGICLVGGVREPPGVHKAAIWGGTPESNFTRAQYAALEELIQDILWRHKAAKVSGHNDWDAKACPCFNVKEWWYGETEGAG